MATEIVQLPILNHRTRANANGAVWLRTALSSENLEDFSIYFPEPTGADVQLSGGFSVPTNYDGTIARIVWDWMGDDVTPVGVVGWEFKYKKTAIGENYISAFLETLATTVAAPVFVTRAQTKLTMNPALLAIGDDVRFTFSRKDSTDTASNNARVQHLFFEYQAVSP